MYNITKIETTSKTVQTAFRFRPEMIAQIKLRARLEGISVNYYVEAAITAYFEKDGDSYEKLYRQIGDLKAGKAEGADDSTRLVFPKMKGELNFTDEELVADPKLNYLINKHLR